MSGFSLSHSAGGGRLGVDEGYRDVLAETVDHLVAAGVDVRLTIFRNAFFLVPSGLSVAIELKKWIVTECARCGENASNSGFLPPDVRASVAA